MRSKRIRSCAGGAPNATRSESRRFVDYFVDLEATQIVRIPRPEALAAALLTLVDATLRAGVVAAAAPDRAAVRGVADVFERAIFGSSPARC